MKQIGAKNQSRVKLFSRRAMFLGGGKALLLSVLMGRLYQLQVVQAPKYRVLGDKNRINVRLVPPLRGVITDRYGRLLAVNKKNFRVVLIREEAEKAGDIKQTLQLLSRVIPLKPREIQRIIQKSRRRRGYVPITVKENLSWQQVAQIEVHSLELPGIMIDVGRQRFYPNRADTTHAVGYVGAVSENDLEQSGDPVLQLPDFRIGRNGIEKKFDLDLRGEARANQVEVNAFGRVIREVSKGVPKAGSELRLTLDIDLQKFALEQVADQSASIMVMDVHNGDVLVMASSPTYDPNMFTRGLSNKEWNELISNPMTPLINKTTSGQYPPGSVFKMVTALAALEAGINPSGGYYCPGFLEVGRERFHCWKRGGHGWQNMSEALGESCDVYFYEVAQRVGIDNIAKVATRLGLGSAVPFDLPSQAKGTIPTKDWKYGTYGVGWKRGETLVCSIGQGYVLTTPLQNAVSVARMVNGGYAVTPRLVSHVFESDFLTKYDGRDIPAMLKAGARVNPQFEHLGFKESHLREIRLGMDMAVNHRQGTAYKHRIKEKEWRMGGKTGTAQVRRISKRERARGVKRNEDLPWKYRDHALFVGYAPVHAPRYLASVFVEHGGGGSSNAAPIAQAVLTETQRVMALRERESVPPVMSRDYIRQIDLASEMQEILQKNGG